MPPPKDPLRRKEYCKKMSHPGNKNPFFGKTHSIESRQKMSDAHKGIFPTEETRKKLSESRKGKPLSEEHKHNISKSHIGKKRGSFSLEWVAKMSESHKGKLAGEKHPFYGKHLSEGTKLKLSMKNKGQKRSEEFCHKISECNTGEKHPNWKGGISYEPYCPKFNNEFKERVRAFFGYKCQMPGCHHVWQHGERMLAVHHVNFRKDACCSEDVVPLFVPLCWSCHSKTQFRRADLEQYFTEIINHDYGGKCYFTKEEMEQDGVHR